VLQVNKVRVDQAVHVVDFDQVVVQDKAEAVQADAFKSVVLLNSNKK
jgi:hypothetical protein